METTFDILAILSNETKEMTELETLEYLKSQRKLITKTITSLRKKRYKRNERIRNKKYYKEYAHNYWLERRNEHH